MLLLRNPSRGISLTELLVVIAAISALVALTLPGVRIVQQSARQASCQNRMGQMGHAFLSYANDWRGFLPVSPPTGQMQLQPYGNPSYATINRYALPNSGVATGFNDAFFLSYDYYDSRTRASVGTVAWALAYLKYLRDPGDRDFTSANLLNKTDGTWSGTDYVLNQYVLARTTPPFQWHSMRLNAISSPSGVYMVACGGRNYMSWIQPGSTSPCPSGLQDYHVSRGRKNVLFADWHVESLVYTGNSEPGTFPIASNPSYPSSVTFWNVSP